MMRVCLRGERKVGRRGSYSAAQSQESLAGSWEAGLAENRRWEGRASSQSDLSEEPHVCADGSAFEPQEGSATG